MSVYGRFFAMAYDTLMSGSEKATLGAHRRALLGQASGRVLEIGGGTGANLPFYSDEVDELTVTEPEAPMTRRLERHLRDQPLRSQLVAAPAEQLPFQSGSFDTAVSTLVLCTVDDQPRALAELRRVLKPGGRLLFIEHVRAAEPRLAGWQDRFNPVQRRVGHGCNCNRATLDAILAAGFRIIAVQHDQLKKAPPIVRPLIVGTAQVGAEAG